MWNVVNKLQKKFSKITTSTQDKIITAYMYDGGK